MVKQARAELNQARLKLGLGLVSITIGYWLTYIRLHAFFYKNNFYKNHQAQILKN